MHPLSIIHFYPHTLIISHPHATRSTAALFLPLFQMTIAFVLLYTSLYDIFFFTLFLVVGRNLARCVFGLHIFYICTAPSHIPYIDILLHRYLHITHCSHTHTLHHNSNSHYLHCLVYTIVISSNKELSIWIIGRQSSVSRYCRAVWTICCRTGTNVDAIVLGEWTSGEWNRVLPS